VTGDCHAPFWGSPGVTPPGHPTLLTALTSSQFPVNDLAGRTSCDAAIGTGRSDHDPVH
jgi:hypothetical protein